MSGSLFILAFVILSAFRDVFFAGALRAAPFFAVALIAFTTCTAAFLGVALAERERTLRVVSADWRTLLLMNLFTACAWLCYFQSLRYLEPAVANVLHAGLGPLTILAMGAVGWRIVDAGAMTALEAACQVAMGLCLAAMVASALLGLSAAAGGTTALIGCACVTVSGAAITIATLYAKRLHDHGASAAAVVATRFIGVLLAAATALLVGPAEARATAGSAATWLSLVPAAFILMAVPIYLNQIGVERASPLTVRVLQALGPVFLIALQTLVGGAKLSGYSLAGVTAYCAIAIMAALARIAGARISARAVSAPARPARA
ncbi:MAG TPA: DMT family transporter [Xanthobacteraceae bacterium]|nr:DMT family transporter [Xanthobacteraceae bacterium]